MTSPGAVQPAEPLWAAFQRRGNDHLVHLEQNSDCNRLEELARLQQACACYREALRILREGDLPPTAEVLNRHVGACRRLVVLLDELGEHAAAIAALQEAADIYGLLDTPEGNVEREECAREIVRRTASLRQTPSERLYLLVTHFERRLLRLEVENAEGSEQAEICLKLASVFLRSAHPTEAAIYLRRAIDHLGQNVAPTDFHLAAGAHYRLGTIMAEAMGQPAQGLEHLKAAITYYTKMGRLSKEAETDCKAAARLLTVLSRQNPRA